MPLPADDITVMRKWIGDEPDTPVLESLHDIYDNYDKVVEHVLIQRLANLSLEVGSVTVPGLSVSHTTDLQAVKDTLSKFYASGGTGLEDTFEVGGAVKVTTIQKNYDR
ncbi:MAG: hypothetical protein GTO63_16820 [Anaerolineae bacterium]|nr:hypothetical protein [Anaerolineae bacterium]NIN96461.1 hypothetical protein [Anaerolineae bacterium]